MRPKCEVVTVAPVLLAVTQDVVPRSLISARIRDMFGVVYTWVRDAPVRRVGNNYALYDQCAPDRLRMQVGFPVSGPFADTDQVRCVPLEPGRAARAVHVGPYAEMHRTYAALHEWCARGALEGTGQSWEVYGDWSDDPSKLKTELFLRLKEE